MSTKRFVSSHARRMPLRRRPSGLRPAPPLGIFPTPLDVRDLHERIDEVLARKRGGYTWTGRWQFDADSKSDMARIYEDLGPRVMHVIATTNRTFAEWQRHPESAFGPVGPNSGLGAWRSDDGTVYIDNIMVRFGLTDDQARRIARSYGQKSVLKVDGRNRVHAFLDV